MNASLFRTRYLLYGAIISAGFIAWWQVGGFALGRGGDGNVSYLLWSGWVAVALYLAVIAYVGRKYIQRVKRPPTRDEVAAYEASIDRAETRIKKVEREILSGVLKAEGDIRKRVQAICRDEGVAKFKHPVLIAGEGGGPAFRVELVSNEPAGRVIVWLHAHLYFGLAAAVLVILHGGLVWSTPMGLLLNGLSFLVTITGVIGVYYWAVGPSMLTRAEGNFTIEEAFALERHFALKLEDAFTPPVKNPEKEIDKAYEKDKVVFDEVVKLQGFAKSCAKEPSPAKVEQQLTAVLSEDAKVAGLQRDVAVLIAQRGKAGDELRRLSRIRFLINSWRVVHVPASIALVGVLVVHIFTVWMY